MGLDFEVKVYLFDDIIKTKSFDYIEEFKSNLFNRGILEGKDLNEMIELEYENLTCIAQFYHDSRRNFSKFYNAIHQIYEDLILRADNEIYPLIEMYGILFHYDYVNHHYFFVNSIKIYKIKPYNFISYNDFVLVIKALEFLNKDYEFEEDVRNVLIEVISEFKRIIKISNNGCIFYGRWN